MEILDSLVIGAGQAGLSASYHLARRGIDHVVLDADAASGGAWQHRWDSLTMHDVHGVASLPDSAPPGEVGGRANEVVPAYFSDYERAHDLPVVRPVRVDRVTDEDGLRVGPASRRSAASSCTPPAFRAPSTSVAGGPSSSVAGPQRCSCSARSPR